MWKMSLKSLTLESVYGACGSLVVKALGYKPEGHGFDTRWGEILNLPNPSSCTKKIVFLGSKVRPVRGADNLTAIYEPIV
jgi:hypothetical protein